MLREKTACWGSHTASAAVAKGVPFRPAQSAYDFDADQGPRLAAGKAGPAMFEGNMSVPENAGGIVLFTHGAGSSRLSPRNRFVARVLNAAGLSTLLFGLLTPEEEARLVRLSHRHSRWLFMRRTARRSGRQLQHRSNIVRGTSNVQRPFPTQSPDARVKRSVITSQGCEQVF
jgi:hypothetical protein